MGKKMFVLSICVTTITVMFDRRRPFVVRREGSLQCAHVSCVNITVFCVCDKITITFGCLGHLK